MAERFLDGAPPAEIGRALRQVPATGPGKQPDEATRARFEEDLREASGQLACPDAIQDVAYDASTTPIVPAKAEEAGDAAPLSDGTGDGPVALPVMALPVPAGIAGPAPVLSQGLPTVTQDPERRHPLHGLASTVYTRLAAEDIQLAMTLRVLGEGLAIDGAPSRMPGRNGDQVGRADVQGETSPAVPAMPSELDPNQRIVLEATPGTPFPADTLPVDPRTSELSTAVWTGVAVVVPPSSGVAIPPAATSVPRVLPEQIIEDAVARLMVGTDRDGAQQVRLELRNEWMPGVRMVLQEAGGRIQIDVICAVDASRQRLSAISSREISDIARRCRRDLLVRVQSEESADIDGSPDCHVVLGVA